MDDRGIGRILREEREKKGLSIGEAASQMRLSKRQVEAIEAEDFQALPGKTFVRGFIRNYARLLQIDSEPLLQGIDPVFSEQIKVEAQPAEEAIPFTNGKKTSNFHYAIWLLILLFPFLVLEIWRENRAPEPAPAPVVADAAQSPVAASQSMPLAASTPVEESAPLAASAPSMPAANPLASAPMAAKMTVSVPVSLKTIASAPAAAKTIASAPAAVFPNAAPVDSPIKMSFAADAWVEVRDAGGKVVFSKLCRAGTDEYAGGNAPFALVVGNARSVKLSYKGAPVDLNSHINVTVARLTLE